MNNELQGLGLSPFFVAQLTMEELEGARIARVSQVQRSVLRVLDSVGERTLPLPADYQSTPSEDRPTVGDWVVLSEDGSRIERVLERKSVFRRVAAGGRTELQLIAANVDILFVVSSCNEELKESRLERYLALAGEAGVLPVVVLTKTDLAVDADSYRERALSVQAGISVVMLNALDAESFRELRTWIEPGTTVALVGSSGVGKTTILNTLMGASVAATAAIREDDKKGRHTTTSRSLYRLPAGGVVIDVPGMRELKVADVGEALGTVFEDVESLARECRFADCSHQSEPGCAVRAAIAAGRLSERRLENYRKLQRESARHTATLAETRRSDREFARQVRQVIALKRKRGESD